MENSCTLTQGPWRFLKRDPLPWERTTGERPPQGGMDWGVGEGELPAPFLLLGLVLRPIPRPRENSQMLNSPLSDAFSPV